MTPHKIFVHIFEVGITEHVCCNTWGMLAVEWNVFVSTAEII